MHEPWLHTQRVFWRSRFCWKQGSRGQQEAAGGSRRQQHRPTDRQSQWTVQQAMITGGDTDEAVRQTDFDALSSRLSCFLKGYTPEDRLLGALVPLLVHYQVAGCGSEFKRFALARRLRSQFFNVLPANIGDVAAVAQLDRAVVAAKTGRFTPLKPPLINRGTYLRTTAISRTVEQFVARHRHAGKLQVVSLGAGSDTRAFGVVAQNANVHYYELDFEQTARLKKLAILSSEQLSACVGAPALPPAELPRTAAQIAAVDPTLHTDRYHLVPCDLRGLTPERALHTVPGLERLDGAVPTLVVSECCLCYLSQDDSDNVVRFWRRSLDDGEFVVYEPLGGSDQPQTAGDAGRQPNRFGEVMVKNLICRGIEMPTLLVYGTVAAQIERFRRLLDTDTQHRCDVWCKDMKWVYDHEVDDAELERISRLEMLDELEELNLINSHYCLVVARWQPQPLPLAQCT